MAYDEKCEELAVYFLEKADDSFILQQFGWNKQIASGRERDEWRHEAAEWQRLK